MENIENVSKCGKQISSTEFIEKWWTFALIA